MKIDLMPFMSVLVTEEAFLAATPELLQTPIVNVLGNDGQMYVYSRFSLGRSMLIASTKTTLSNGKPSILKEELQPLAFGNKIPSAMLDKILAFFKEVMEMTGSSGKHGEYEAMAHIVWNTRTKSYRIAIPKQKVSKAAVTYTWEHVDEDYETVIFDIHSHNTMDAFFSGTDEADDRSYIGISGVAGRLNTDAKLIWRFNAFKQKVKMEYGDIFDAPEKSAMPEMQEWMDKVTIPPAYVAPAYGNGYSYKPGGVDPKSETRVFGVAKARAGIADQSSIEDNLFSGNESSWFEKNQDFPGAGLGLDDLAEDLADKVWNEEDDELNAEVAAVLAKRVVETETLYDAGVFIVTNRAEAAAAIARLNSDYTIGQ